MRRRGYDLEARNDAAEIKIRAKRRLGQLIIEWKKNLGARE
jgi:hypothetical protein